jgi:hypothetical protein
MRGALPPVGDASKMRPRPLGLARLRRARGDRGGVADDRVMVDFAHVPAQPGRDVFVREGWEACDRGDKTSRGPAEKEG